MEAPLEDDAPKAKPPKKRRKVDEPVESSAIVEAEDDDDSMPVDIPEAPSIPAQEHIPAGSLPSFPLPTHPDLPSRSDLALQGLDKALIDAEFVDPSNVLDIPPEGDDDGGSGLSERVRKRLHELGVTQLFAGTSSSRAKYYFLNNHSTNNITALPSSVGSYETGSLPSL